MVILLERRGQCKQCGSCCRVPQPCSFLRGNKCAAYDRRPMECRLFPRHPYEQGYNSAVCGFQFHDRDGGGHIPSSRDIAPMRISKNETPTILGIEAMENIIA